ncbi:MAG: hypothetical protein PQJ61_04600 [Spirochaetales bacterium]|uniref:Uncharacterized protein n=1 Tax=Candidatus Thalassospirochaeta sargassi TaxID=3119039 RepID=A0AAJ1IB47_9SPIO|nr:hypothetical protein [Spirochaetales bacterium]
MNKKMITTIVLFSFLVLLYFNGCDFTNEMGRREMVITNYSANEITSIEFNGRELVYSDGSSYTLSSEEELTMSLEFIAEGSYSMTATDSSGETDTETIKIDDEGGEVNFFEIETTISITNNTGKEVICFALTDTYSGENVEEISGIEYWIGDLTNIFFPISNGSTETATEVDSNGFVDKSLYVYAWIYDSDTEEGEYVNQGTMSVTSGETNTFTATVGN